MHVGEESWGDDEEETMTMTRKQAMREVWLRSIRDRLSKRKINVQMIWSTMQ
jgi:hypothetical protein